MYFLMKQNDLETIVKLETNYNMMHIMQFNSIILIFHRFEVNHTCILNKMYKHWKTGSVKFKDQDLLENLPIKFHTINSKTLYSSWKLSSDLLINTAQTLFAVLSPFLSAHHRLIFLVHTSNICSLPHLLCSQLIWGTLQGCNLKFINWPIICNMTTKVSLKIFNW